MRRGVCLILLLALCAGGCATLSPGSSGGVDEVHLFGLPVTLDMDSKPGRDGFAVRVFVTKGGGAKGVVINSGAIEVLMFDGVVGPGEFATKEPNQVWKFNPRELAPHREQTTLGNGYRFALRWKEPPTRGHITVAARFVPEKGEPIYSSPSTISAAIK